MAIFPIFIPTFISTVDYKPARILPRIYYYNGLKGCDAYFAEGYAETTGSVTSASLSEFPYFDHYSGNTPTSGSNSLLFNNEDTPYGDIPNKSLYTEYWETYVELLYNPKTRLINCAAIIPLAEYFDLEMNDIVDFKGNYFHLRSVNDYNLNTGECNLQLLGPIISNSLNK